MLKAKESVPKDEDLNQSYNVYSDQQFTSFSHR